MAPPPPNPRLHVANPGEEKPRSKRWDMVWTSAITALSAAAAVGIGVAGWKFGKRQALKLFRRQQLESDAAATLQPTATTTTMYPAGALYQQMTMPIQQPGYPQQGFPQQPWPYAQPMTSELPESLRMRSTFTTVPVAQPVVVAAPVGSEIQPQLTQFFTGINKQINAVNRQMSAMEQKLDLLIGDDGDSDDDDDDDDDSPRRKPS